MLNSGKKNKRINILSLVLSEKKILNEAKNYNRTRAIQKDNDHMKSEDRQKRAQ
jgi:hypothetical protein